MAPGRDPRGGDVRRRARALLAAAAVGLLGAVGVGTLDDAPDEAAAQDPFVPAELVSYEPSGTPLASNGRNPAMSALGHVVSYEYSPPTSDQFSPYSPLIRVRTDPSVGVPNPAVGQNHGLSDDGCVIAYTGPYERPPGDEFGRLTMYRFDRCVSGASTRLGFSFDAFVRGRPAVDADGSVIAFPGFGGVTVFTMSGSSVASSKRIVLPNESWTAWEAAISDDGALLAVVLGPDGDNNGFPDAQSLWVVDVASESWRGISSTARNISMSGDGSLVAFEDYELRQIRVLDRSTDQIRSIDVPRARSAAISRDGRHLALEVSGGDPWYIYVSSSADRWRSSTPPEYVSYPFPDVFYAFSVDPVVSEHGRWVGWVSPNAANYVDRPPSLARYDRRQVLVRERRPVLTVQSIDYGTVPGPVDRTSVVTNVGPSGWRVTAIEATGAFQVRSEDCPAVLHPGASCQVTVRYLAPSPGQTVGELRVRDDSYPGIPLAAGGRLVGALDPGSPPSDVSTTTTTTSVPGSRAVVTTTTTVPGTPRDVGLTIAPNPIVFGSTVVGASAPIQDATVTNVGEVSVTVQSVGIAGVATADFDVVDDGCSNITLTPGASCIVKVGFTPTAAGARAAAVSASGTGRTFAAGSLRGSGRYDVELEVSPDVASGGQVVTVTGTGYPASSPVQVGVVGSAPQSASTDGTGRFDVQWIVLQGTPQGVLRFDDVATGEYDAESVDLQIVPSPMRPQANPAANPALRSHVSR